MRKMKHIEASRRDLRRASGEQLLLLAVFGDAALRLRLDDELDRRAADTEVRNPRPPAAGCLVA